MAYYRLYFLDGFSGHIDHVRAFEARDDAAAVADASKWRGFAAMELWSNDRKIRRWEAVYRAPPEMSARQARA
jgi:hypothetical protein